VNECAHVKTLPGSACVLGDEQNKKMSPYQGHQDESGGLTVHGVDLAEISPPEWSSLLQNMSLNPNGPTRLQCCVRDRDEISAITAKVGEGA